MAQSGLKVANVIKMNVLPNVCRNQNAKHEANGVDEKAVKECLFWFSIIIDWEWRKG